MPANILNLPDFKVQWVEEADHDYHVYAEVSNPPGVCTACGSNIGPCECAQIVAKRSVPEGLYPVFEYGFLGGT